MPGCLPAPIRDTIFCAFYSWRSCIGSCRSDRLRTRIAQATPWIRTVEEAVLVGDVRGGDSFSDIYGMKRFLYGFLMAWTVILVRGSMVQFPQTYGPDPTTLGTLVGAFSSAAVIGHYRPGPRKSKGGSGTRGAGKRSVVES